MNDDKIKDKIEKLILFKNEYNKYINIKYNIYDEITKDVKKEIWKNKTKDRILKMKKILNKNEK